MMKLYVYPHGATREAALVAALSPEDARAFHRESRVATLEEVSSAVVAKMRVPALDPRAGIRDAHPSDFVGARSESMIVIAPSSSLPS